MLLSRRYLLLISVLLIVSIHLHFIVLYCLSGSNAFFIDPKDQLFSLWGQINAFAYVFIFPIVLSLFTLYSFFKNKFIDMILGIIFFTAYLLLYFYSPYGIIGWLLD